VKGTNALVPNEVRDLELTDSGSIAPLPVELQIPHFVRDEDLHIPRSLFADYGVSRVIGSSTMRG
jgi:hypothetical protein